jgi:hypothetical protein
MSETGHGGRSLLRTTAFTCRAGRKEREVSGNRDAGPVNCSASFGTGLGPPADYLLGPAAFKVLTRTTSRGGLGRLPDWTKS